MAVWGSVILLIVLVAAGIAVAVARGLQLWRDAKRLNRALGAELARIDEATRSIERQLRNADAASARLRAAISRLERSRARLAVQLDALGEARALVRRVLWFVPGA